MAPVISPWAFYWMGVANKLIPLFFFLAVVFGVVCAISICCKAFEGDDIKTSVIASFGAVCFVCALLAILVPSENTVGKMLVAQNVTYERVENATDIVQSVYEDIMELFEEKDDGK